MALRRSPGCGFAGLGAPVSERRACKAIGQPRSTQRRRPVGRFDEKPLTSAIIELASRYGRYGYRRIHWLLGQEGWHVSLTRVKRIWPKKVGGVRG